MCSCADAEICEMWTSQCLRLAGSMVDKECSTFKAEMKVKRGQKIMCIRAKLYMHRNMTELTYRYKDARKEKDI